MDFDAESAESPKEPVDRGPLRRISHLVRQERFGRDFVKAWTRVMALDRFDLR